MGPLEWVPLGSASERHQQKVWWEVAEQGWDSHPSDSSPVCVPDYRSQLPLGSALHGIPSLCAGNLSLTQDHCPQPQDTAYPLSRTSPNFLQSPV